MTTQEFIAKWKPSKLSERSGSHEHFLDLCAILGEPTPAAADPDGTEYTFERGVTKTDGGKGWADVWKRHFFAWEYKGKHKDLAEAYNQLLRYREDLENPRVLVVCDMDRFQVHTNFTDTVKRIFEFDLDSLAENLEILRRVFRDPEKLKPDQTPRDVTEELATKFAKLADGMRARDLQADHAAHFLMKLMFCMFAEGVELLENKVFTKILAGTGRKPAKLSPKLAGLFQAMSKGGDFGADTIRWINGGLFDDAEVIDLTPDEIGDLIRVNESDWSNVEPTIFGTLFERTLDPDKRSQIGGHFTGKDDILTLLEPVLMAPLRREWEEVKARAEQAYAKLQETVRAGKPTKKQQIEKKDSKPRKAFDRILTNFLDRLAGIKILDPSCGSGNFLYVSIKLLLDLEKEVLTYGRNHGFTSFPNVEPTQLLGIEINPYAQQFAQIVIWIGYLQWLRDNGYGFPAEPILKKFENILHMDAIMDLTDPANPKEPDWPDADFIVGNPPFLGGKKIRRECGHDYFEQVLAIFKGRIPPFSDLCCYWFEKTRGQIEHGKCRRAGLLATQALRGGANRVALDRVKQTGDIFFGVSDRDWILEGATVHVSMVGFDDGREEIRTLDGKVVNSINANLRTGPDTTKAIQLRENRSKSFIGIQKSGPFDVTIDEALSLMRTPNASGRCNSDVLRPYLNALDIVRRSQEVWVIDFDERTLEDSSQYEGPFEYVKTNVKPIRDVIRRERHRDEWWRHGETRRGMRFATKGFARMLVTPLVAKHFVITWLSRF